MRKKQIDLFGAISWTMFPGLMANQSIGPRRLPFRPIWTRDEETDSQYLFTRIAFQLLLSILWLLVLGLIFLAPFELAVSNLYKLFTDL